MKCKCMLHSNTHSDVDTNPSKTINCYITATTCLQLLGNCFGLSATPPLQYALTTQDDRAVQRPKGLHVEEQLCNFGGCKSEDDDPTWAILPTNKHIPVPILKPDHQ